MRRTKRTLRIAVAHRAAVAEVACHVGALNVTHGPSAWAVRPSAAGEPLHPFTHPRIAGVGCPSTGGQRATGSARKRRYACVSSSTESSVKRSLNTTAKWPGFVQSCRIRSSRWPCGVPQRQAAGSARAPASPVPVASARLAAREIRTGFPRTVGAGAYVLGHEHEFTSAGGNAPCPHRGLTLPSKGRPQAGFAHLRPPLMSNVRRPEKVAAALLATLGCAVNDEGSRG